MIPKCEPYLFSQSTITTTSLPVGDALSNEGAKRKFAEKIDEYAVPEVTNVSPSSTETSATVTKKLRSSPTPGERDGSCAVPTTSPSAEYKRWLLPLKCRCERAFEEIEQFLAHTRECSTMLASVMNISPPNPPNPACTVESSQERTLPDNDRVVGGTTADGKAANLAVTDLSRPFKCCHCVKSFKSKALLDQHMHIHYPPKYTCRYCAKKYRWPPVFYHHQRTCKKRPPATTTCPSSINGNPTEALRTSASSGLMAGSHLCAPSRASTQHSQSPTLRFQLPSFPSPTSGMVPLPTLPSVSLPNPLLFYNSTNPSNFLGFPANPNSIGAPNLLESGSAESKMQAPARCTCGTEFDSLPYYLSHIGQCRLFGKIIPPPALSRMTQPQQQQVPKTAVDALTKSVQMQPSPQFTLPPVNPDNAGKLFPFIGLDSLFPAMLQNSLKNLLPPSPTGETGCSNADVRQEESDNSPKSPSTDEPSASTLTNMILTMNAFIQSRKQQLQKGWENDVDMKEQRHANNSPLPDPTASLMMMTMANMFAKIATAAAASAAPPASPSDKPQQEVLPAAAPLPPLLPPTQFCSPADLGFKFFPPKLDLSVGVGGESA
ncbi:unnamed protein product, partial [Dibothriocephalus latus]